MTASFAELSNSLSKPDPSDPMLSTGSSVDPERGPAGRNPQVTEHLTSSMPRSSFNAPRSFASTRSPIIEHPQSCFERFAVAIVFTVFVLFRASDRVFLYRVQKYMQKASYNLILSNLI